MVYLEELYSQILECIEWMFYGYTLTTLTSFKIDISILSDTIKTTIEVLWQIIEVSKHACP